jgi:hypothetical protein
VLEPQRIREIQHLPHTAADDLRRGRRAARALRGAAVSSRACARSACDGHAGRKGTRSGERVLSAKRLQNAHYKGSSARKLSENRS